MRLFKLAEIFLKLAFPIPRTRQEAAKILGVSEMANEAEIGRAQRMMTLKHHPDLNPEDPEALVKMKAINRAVDLLKQREYSPPPYEARPQQPQRSYYEPPKPDGTSYTEALAGLAIPPDIIWLYKLAAKYVYRGDKSETDYVLVGHAGPKKNGKPMTVYYLGAHNSRESPNIGNTNGSNSWIMNMTVISKNGLTAAKLGRALGDMYDRMAANSYRPGRPVLRYITNTNGWERYDSISTGSVVSVKDAVEEMLAGTY